VDSTKNNLINFEVLKARLTSGGNSNVFLGVLARRASFERKRDVDAFMNEMFKVRGIISQREVRAKRTFP
jgi:hypothetical protein